MDSAKIVAHCDPDLPERPQTRWRHLSDDRDGLSGHPDGSTRIEGALRRAEPSAQRLQETHAMTDFISRATGLICVVTGVVLALSLSVH